jgi:hypothetical protein
MRNLDNLNFGASGSERASTSGLQSPPLTQQQQHLLRQQGQPPHPPPAPPADRNQPLPPNPNGAPADPPAVGEGPLRTAAVGDEAHPPAPADRVDRPNANAIELGAAAELIALRARIAQLKAVAPHMGAAPPPIPPVLFATPEVIDRVREAAAASRDNDKKIPLPDIVPSFKANSLDVREYDTSFTVTSGALLPTWFPFRCMGVWLLVAIGPSDSQHCGERL